MYYVQQVCSMMNQVCKLCCGFQSNVAASNAKLALFYDWFFFDAEKDSIMNIGSWLFLQYFVHELLRYN